MRRAYSLILIIILATIMVTPAWANEESLCIDNCEEELLPASVDYNSDDELLGVRSYIVAEGACGDNAVYTVSDYGSMGIMLEISGSGELWDYSDENRPPWEEFMVDCVEVFDGITRIGSCTFKNCSSLKEMYMADSVIDIGYEAFMGCTELYGVQLCDGLEIIGECAFANCNSIARLEIPSSVTTIGNNSLGMYSDGSEYRVLSGFLLYCGDNSVACDYAVNNAIAYITNSFNGEVIASGSCGTNTTYVVYDTAGDGTDNLLVISGTGKMSDFSSSSAPWSKYSIKRLIVMNGVETIGKYAFYNKSALESVVFPDSLTSIGELSFNKCSGLTELFIPNSVNLIGNQAFGYCSGIKEVKLSSNLTSINMFTFVACTKLEKIEFPDSITSIQPRAFEGCTSLIEVNLPSRLTCIDNVVFSGCTNLKKVTYPSTISSIGNGSFQNCKSLEDFVIPDTVTQIGFDAFNGCTSLETMNIPNGVISIGDKAFYKCPNIKRITVPSSVTSIGSQAMGYYVDNGTVKMIDGFVICGVVGTIAETYANDNNICFVDSSSYKIVYNLDGGINDLNNPETYKYGDRIELYNPKKSGYYFAGWYSDEGYVNCIDRIEETSSGDVTLYAKWDKLFELMGYRLTLNGNCDLQYIVKPTERLKNIGNYYMEFTVGEKTTIVNNPSTFGDYHVYVCEVPAKHMNDSIIGTLYANGESHTLEPYSVREYLETIITNESNSYDYAIATDLAKTILNYGGYAQKYFEYNTDNPANSEIYSQNDDPVLILSDEFILNNVDTSVDGKLSNSDFEYAGASLVCNSDTNLNIYLKNLNNLDIDEIKTKYRIYSSGRNDSTINTSLKDGMLVLTVENIPATELSTIYTFYIKNGTDSIAIEYSPMDYVRKAMSSDNENLKNLCKALYLYNIEARRYYNNNGLLR